MQVITTHTNTDLDGMGAAVAARKLYPEAVLVFPGKLSRNVEEFLALYKDTLAIQDIKNINLEQIEKLIVVDTKNARRLGKLGNIASKEGLDIHIYDHHPWAAGDLRGSLETVDTVGATVTLLVEKIKKQNIPVSPLEATIMIMGIYGDTGSLLFTNTTPRDIRAAAYLLEQGAKLSVVADFLGRPLTDEQKSLLKDLVMSATHHSVNGVKVLLAKAQVDEFVVGLATLTHTLAEIERPDAIFTVVEMEDRVHIVGRSNVSQVNVNKIMSSFGGAGHPEAASATIKNASVHEVTEKLLQVIYDKVQAPLLVSDIMSSPVKSVVPATTIAEANQIMLRYGHTGLPVVENDKVVGVISRRDVEKAYHHGLGHAPVKGFMTNNVITVSDKAPISRVQELMIEHDIGRLPVTVDGRLVGIVSRTDVLRTLHGEVQARHRKVYSNSKKPSYYNNISDLMRQSLSPSIWSVLKQAGKIADNMGYNIYAAGGIVRDVMLGADSLDVDLVVEGDGIMLAQALGSAYDAKVRKHEKFGTAELEFPDGLKVDVATARIEFYEYPAALPKVESSSLRQDLYRRDFTINAMAVSLNEKTFGKLVDYFGGREDLQYGLTGLIRVLHNLSFIEDPTRILRAVRFEQRYQMGIEPQTAKLLVEAVNQKVLKKVSNARLWDEIKHILLEPRAGEMLGRLVELGIWPFLFPGVDFRKTEPVVKKMAESMSVIISWGFPELQVKWLPYLIAILHRSDRNTCLKICAKYNLAKRLAEKILVTASNWREIFSLVSEIPQDTPTSKLAKPVLSLPRESYPVLLSLMDEERLRDRFRALLSAIQSSKPRINGKYIKSLGYRPGPIYREVLETVWQARLDGKVVTEEEEKAFAREYLRKTGGEIESNV